VPVTTLVVNKVIEDAGDCQRCQGKQAVQQESIAALRESLPDLDVWTIPDQSGEVTGISALDRVAESLVDVK
jgi:arsenite-transporting ATPase